MIKNYLQTALRSLLKHRLYTTINIVGLTVGLLSCMIAATVVIDDLSYDKQWSRGKNVYRIITNVKLSEGLYDRFAGSFSGLGPVLKKNYPEIDAYSEMSPSELRLKLNKDENGNVVSLLETDTLFWQLLDTKIIAGTPRKFVAGTPNLVISESFKNKYFHNEDPVGKVVYDVSFDKPNSYLITGVIKDIPSNTHLRAEVIEIKERTVQALPKDQIGAIGYNYYILIKPGTDIEKFTQKVNNWYKDFVSTAKPFSYEFQPIQDVYLHSDFSKDQKVKGNIQNLYIVSGVALLVLLIACVNFINLSTARVATRLRETGIRKVLGASRRQIIFQFLTEALLFFVMSAVVAFILYEFCLQPVEAFFGHSLEQTILSHFSSFALVFALMLVVSLLTGLYPAWLLSGFKTSNTIKGRLFANSSYRQNWLRKGLVVLQFSISIVVVLSMIVVQYQLRFMQSSDPGFNKHNLLSISSVAWNGKGDAFKNELAIIPGVLSASKSTWIPGSFGGMTTFKVDDPNHSGHKLDVWYIAADADFARTVGLRLNEGRLLSSESGIHRHKGDSLQKTPEIQPCLITTTTAKLLNITRLNDKSSLSKLGHIMDGMGLDAVEVPVGVVADFHNLSFYESLGPTIITVDASLDYCGMLVRVAPGTDRQVMASLQKLWQQFYPGKLLETSWVDERLAEQYKAEKKLQQLFSLFSALTMALASLGIFGLIVHAAQQRTKEIGVRKVLGASVASIAQLLSFSFVKLVLIAIVVASPVAWYFLNKWLQNFPYPITISWWMFALAGFMAVFIALLTVSLEAIKAAIANPVKSLRSE